MVFVWSGQQERGTRGEGGNVNGCVVSWSSRALLCAAHRSTHAGLSQHSHARQLQPPASFARDGSLRIQLAARSLLLFLPVPSTTCCITGVRSGA